MANGGAHGLVHSVIENLESQGHTNIDDMTIKEVRLKGLGEGEQLASNNEKASVVSVVVFVIAT